MVHRAPDSRLLSALLASEKDVHKALASVPSSSAAFAAYAAASPAPLARTLLGVAGAVAGADEALRTYAASVERWRESLDRVRKLEEDVANVLRDRDILVTRLLKLSSSKKNRDSVIITPSATSPPASISHSTLSLPSSTTSPVNSSKLTAAQAELQACETHLAMKERELDALRYTALRDGLTDRFRAMIDCGWMWGEMGKEGLRVLDELRAAHEREHELPDGPSSQPNGHAIVKPLPHSRGASSDLSSIGPEQSASQIGLPALVNGGEGHHTNGDAYNSSHGHADTQEIHRTTSPQPQSYRPTPPRSPEPEENYTPRLSIPPAHSITDDSSFPVSTHAHPAAPMERRITEVSEPPSDDGSSVDDNASSEEHDGDPAALKVVENPRFVAQTSSQQNNSSSPPKSEANGTAQAPQSHRLFALRTHKRQNSTGTSTVSSTTSPVNQQPPASGSRWLHLPRSRGATMGASASDSHVHVPVATYGSGRDSPDGRRFGRGGSAREPRERKTSGLWGGLAGLFRSKGKEDREEEDSDSERRSKRKNKVKKGKGHGRGRRGSVGSSSEEDGEVVTGGRGTSPRRDEPGPGQLSFNLGRERAMSATHLPATSASGSPARLKKRRASASQGSVQANGWVSDSAGVAGGAGTVRKAALKKTPTKAASDMGSTPRSRSPVRAQQQSSAAPAPAVAMPKPMKPALKHNPALPSHLQLTGDLSRSSSLSAGSVRSAPPAPTSRPKKLMSTGTGNSVTVTRSASTGKNANAPGQTKASRGEKRATMPASVSASAVPIHTTGTSFPSSKTSVPGQGGSVAVRPGLSNGRPVSTAGGVGEREGQQSLMSIVEGVTKANRTGWAETLAPLPRAPPPTTPTAPTAAASLPTHAQRSKSTDDAGGLVVIRAPPRIGAVDLETGKEIPKTKLEAEMERLRAPPSVVDPRAAVYADKKPAPRPTLNPTSRVPPNGNAKPLPAKSPLRSALRVSRSPSPTYPPPPPPAERPAPVLHVPSAPPRVRAPSPPPPPPADDAESDASSVSSYETVHEQFDSVEDVTAAPAVPEKERLAVPVPQANGGDSDVSQSTVEAPVQRRKSVRMSLQPTFSPTPPALDDEGEETPWPAVRGREARKGRREEQDGVREERERDYWQDSSSEDEEYRSAKALLKKARKKW